MVTGLLNHGEIIAASRGFNMEIAEQTDIVRQLGNIVDHPIDSYHAAGGAIDAKIAGAKQAYNETGSVAMAAGEVIGTNRIAGGMANGAGLGPPRAVGGTWNRFNEIGTGFGSTLNSVSIVGGVAAGGVNFVKSVAAGMADAEMANAISSLTKTTIPNCFVAGTQVWVPDDEASDSPQDDQTVADEASEIDSSFLSGLLICAAGVFGCHLIADISANAFP